VRPAPRSRLFTLLALAICAACSGRDAVRASGVQRVLTEFPEIPAWTAAPDLRIDANAEDLVPIKLLLVASDRRMFVSQWQDSRMLIFDSSGKRIGAAGRRGQGPGELPGKEFMETAGAGLLHDTLWISDDSRRAQLFTSDGRFLRSTPRLRLVFPPADKLAKLPFTTRFSIRAVYGDGFLVERSNISGWESVPRDSAALLRVTENGMIESLVRYRPGRDNELIEQREGTTGGVVFVIPFYPRSLYDLAPNGDRSIVIRTSVLSSEGGTFHLTLLGAFGDTLVSRTYPFEGLPITQRMIDSALGPRSMPSRPNRDPELARWKSVAHEQLWTEARELIPPSAPQVIRVELGLDDTIWLQLRSEANGQRWLILDGVGDPIGMLGLPIGSQVHQAARDAVWAVEKDADDVESVVRYRIRPANQR
jgi:hypothetical protein